MGKIQSKKTGNSDAFVKTCSNIISGVINVFLLMLVTVFPLIMHDSYVDILETKYQCYYMIVIGMLIVLLILGIIMLVIDQIEYQGKHAIGLFAKLHPQNWKTTFCGADFAVILFWLTLLISTLQSEYRFESFWGNEGRYSGLFLLTLYIISYFIISRFWQARGWVLEVFLFTGLIICYIGITDYFQMDIMNLRVGIKPEQSTIFTSTLGNINTYTAYVALLLGVAAAMFATAKNVVRASWYYICMVIGFFAIIMGCSDNAYLALGALFGFLPFMLFKSRTGFKRYLLMLATFGTVIQCIDFINQVYAEMVIGLDSLFQLLVNFSGLIYVVAALWVFYIAIMIFDKKQQAVTDEIGLGFVLGWSGLLAICLLIICFLLYDVNIAGNVEGYGGLGRYLLLNESWGTNRGYIWRKSVAIFGEFGFMHKLFGYGPDTFGILTTGNFRMEMMNSTQGQIFDNAHNEYLHYLVTVGGLGMFTYVAFLVTAGWRMAVGRSRNEYKTGCLFAVLCYAAQALVNLSLPIATPIMWLLLSIGMADKGFKVIPGK